MKLLFGILLGLIAHIFTFFQLQGRFKYPWMKDNEWVIVLLGIPISFFFMNSVRNLVEWFNGQLWPSNLMGFAIGTFVFTFMSMILFNEHITIKTGICLFLSFSILLVQIFMK
jgi:membrane-associated HD superfamily phosphohydrolase